jgi:hypothetical protein
MSSTNPQRWARVLLELAWKRPGLPTEWDGPELMRRVREMKPGLPILTCVHGKDAEGDTPPGVPTLREPFTPNQLLLVIGSLMA